MNCSTFQNSEIDALYGELGPADSVAMDEHAASCASCGARFERLRGTRGLVLSVAVESVPDNFESRIMAAVDAGMAHKARALAPLPAPPVKAEGGAKIFQFMARPAFGVAAGFVILLGAAAVFVQTNMRSKMADATASAPAAQAPTAAASMAPAAMDPAADLAGATPTATTGAVALAAPAAAAPIGEASKDFAGLSPAAEAPVARAVATTAPPSRPMPQSVPASPVPMAAAKPTKTRTQAGQGADELSAAKNLASAGRCSEAVPRLEQLKGQHPEAELYLARCTAKTSGCTAAAPRFDTAAQRNAGTDTGSRASLEGAKCYQQNGDVVAARKRFEAAKGEGVAEASQALDALDRKAAAGPGVGGGKASPKAAAPSPAPAPMTNEVK